MVSLHKLARRSSDFDAKAFRGAVRASTTKALRRTYKNGRTALHEAARFGNASAVHILLQRAAELLTPEQYQAYVNARDRLGCTPILYAAAATAAGPVVDSPLRALG